VISYLHSQPLVSFPFASSSPVASPTDTLPLFCLPPFVVSSKLPPRPTHFFSRQHPPACVSSRRFADSEFGPFPQLTLFQRHTPVTFHTNPSGFGVFLSSLLSPSSSPPLNPYYPTCLTRTISCPCPTPFAPDQLSSLAPPRPRQVAQAS